MKEKIEQRRKIKQYTIDQKIRRLRLNNTEKEALNRILTEPIGYIPYDHFRRPSLMAPIMKKCVEVTAGQTLDKEDEQVLFLKMNYARYKLCQIRRKLMRQSPWSKKTVIELLKWYQKQLAARSEIVTVNMGLVLAMAKKVDFPGVEFTDLISEGSMALLRATDKFDCQRGYKFSTYACRAIFKGFSRTAKQSYRYRKRFPTQWDIALEKDDSLEQIRQEDHENGIEEVRTIFQDNLADLSQIEQSVIEMRFSLRPRQSRPLTLKQVGDKLGLTKERIRQIQNKALAKIRDVAEERIVFQ
jgi:RNA polymerase sigma factor (sigma-70 family)